MVNFVYFQLSSFVMIFGSFFLSLIKFFICQTCMEMIFSLYPYICLIDKQLNENLRVRVNVFKTYNYKMSKNISELLQKRYLFKILISNEILKLAVQT